MENKNDKPKSYLQIRDEVIRERGYKDFKVYAAICQPDEVFSVTKEIATRYAAKENEGLRDALRRLSNTVEAVKIGKESYHKEVRLIEAQEHAKSILSKTAHHDNQNTDV